MPPRRATVLTIPVCPDSRLHSIDVPGSPRCVLLGCNDRRANSPCVNDVEFKEIRKEWKARKKEEETQRKAAEDRERAAAQATQANPAEGAVPNDPSQAAPPPSYGGGVRGPQLPPLGYQPADGQVPNQYGGHGAGGMVYQSNGQMGYPPSYPNSPYGQNGQVYQPRKC